MANISRNKRFGKAAKDSVFGAAIAASIEDPSKLQNAIDFIEGPSGMGAVLRPVQRVIVKAIYGVPFDYKPDWSARIPGWGMVPMYDVYREKKLYSDVTEAEYLKITFNEGRCNVSDWRDIPNIGDLPGEAGFNEACIFAGRRGGKALSIDEPIPTPDGFVKNGDLKDGDTVLSPNGKPVKIIYAHEPFLSEVFRVTFDDGTSVLTHPDHRWFTFTRKERKNSNRRMERPKAFAAVAGVCSCGCGNDLELNLRSSETRQFRRGHFLRPEIVGKVRTTEEIRSTLSVGTRRSLQANHSVQLSEAVELSERNLPLDPYCLGAWLGDGRKIGGNGFSSSEEDAPETLKHFSAAGFAWKKSRWKQSWNIYGLTTVLRKMGLLHNKHIPPEYLWASAVQRLSLLQGLMDTDGSCAEDGRVEFCNTNKNLAEGVYHLAASLGLKPFWGEGTAQLNGKNCGVKYRVTWTGILPVFRLTRKLARLPKEVKDTQHWRYIVSVESAGVQTVRCITVDAPDGLFLFGKNFNVTHNSELVAAIAAYKLYLLLNVRCPQEHFGLFPGSIIDFTFLAQDENGAHRLFKKLREHVLKAENFFGPYLKDTNAKDLSFVTLADREKQDSTPTITVSCLPCTTNAVRSPSSIFLALDEFAHFRSAKGSTSDDMYAAASPSTADFHHEKSVKAESLPQELMGTSFGEEPTVQTEEQEPSLEFEGENETVGIQDSMILSISSPLKKIGKMYELHKLALEEGVASGIFTLNCPSAEMNPKLLPKFLKSEYKKNPLTFRAEYGGKFLESSESYVTEASVKACTDCQWDEKGLPVEGSARINIQRFTPMQIGRNYFWGFDLGMTNDASALSIAHLEPGGPHGTIRLVYDYIDRMMVGEAGEWPGVKSAPGDDKYANYQVLPLEDILNWMDEMNKILPCFRGATDQHGGQQLVQLLELKKIRNFELVNITPSINSQMAYVLRGFIEDKRCTFPYVPKFIQELKLVELEVTAKYRIRVAAPQEKGAHDDMADATMLCAFLAQRWLMEQGQMMDPSGLSLLMQTQATKPPVPMLGLDGIPMSILKIMEKLKKSQQFSASYSGANPVSPWSRRGKR